MPKKVLPSVDTADTAPEGASVQLIRVEEDVQDFLSIRLPSVTGTSKLETKQLWSSKDKKTSYFRCNYWKYDYNSIVITRHCIKSVFVRVDTLANNEKQMTEMTTR